MVQLVPYQIYVHGSFINEAVFQLLGGILRDSNGELIQAGRFVRDQKTGVVTLKKSPGWLNYLQKHTVSRADLLEDSSPQAKQYEKDMLVQLEKLRASKVGKCVLENIPKDMKVFIVRHNSLDELTTGNCNARALHGRFKGAIRLSMNPDAGCADEYSGLDDTLLHELYHAYNFIAGADFDYYYQPMRESKTREEFLAVQVANMYRSEINAGILRRVYGAGTQPRIDPPGIGTASELEAYFSRERDVWETLVPSSPLLRELAGLKGVPFNPFRDWKSYEIAYNNSLRGKFDVMNKIRPLIAPMR